MSPAGTVNAPFAVLAPEAAVVWKMPPAVVTE